jgi:HAD superfamily 5'-nucleotidase-like hydrolase
MSEKKFRFPTQTFLQLVNLFQPSTIRYSRRVFVNRNLRMAKIQAVGFDMDYTLAIYNQKIDALEFELTARRLVEKHGFPQVALGFKYDPEFAIRGLVIDMELGNIFKMDRHRHVCRACHGTRIVEPEQRNALYRKKLIRLSKPVYSLIDTLFSVPETHLYALAVDLLDRTGQSTPEAYQNVYRAIRDSADEIHRDGTLKKVVMADLARYVERDLDIAHTLEHLICSGKKLFIVTNSGWDYTDAMMSFLLDGVVASFPRWTDFFSVVVVDARKPDFFAHRARLRPCPQAGGDLAPKVYCGGSLTGLEIELAASGDNILYVGDHIYGDILRSKKSSTWRTAMIIPEMESELESTEAVREDLLKLDRLFLKRNDLNVELNYLQRLLMSLLNIQDLASHNGNGHETAEPLSQVARVTESNVAALKESLEKLARTMEKTEFAILSRFNPHWGMLFKEGMSHTVFGEQVEDYACLYTSRITNFLSYSPLHYFQAARDKLAHERDE